MKEFKPDWIDKLPKRPFNKRTFSDQLMRKIEDRLSHETIRNRAGRRSAFVALSSICIAVLILFVQKEQLGDLLFKHSQMLGNPIQGTTPKEQSTASSINVNFIKTNLELGQTQAEVKQLLSDKFVEITDSGTEAGVLYSLYAWRYDFGVKPGFKVETRTGHQGWAHTEAIETGEVEMQIFITWNKDKAEMISLCYKDEMGQVQFYQVEATKQTGK